MKIKAFADKHQCKISTVRYYTDLGLLLPDRKGTYANYDVDCHEDMEKIIRLRNLDFPINDISKMMTILRIGVTLNDKEVEQIHDIIINKEEEINKKITLLKENINDIKKFKLEIETQVSTLEKNGMSVKMLDYIRCPICGAHVDISDAKISCGKVLHGELNCKCSYSMAIKNGILYANEYEKRIDLSEYGVDEDSCVDDFMDSSNMKIINYLGAFVNNQLEKYNHVNGLLFLNADSDIIMMKTYELFVENGQYIFISPDIEALEALRKRLDAVDARGEMLFIYSSEYYPLRNNIESIFDNCSNSCDLLFSKEKFSTLEGTLKTFNYKNFLSVLLITKTLHIEGKYAEYYSFENFKNVLNENNKTYKLLDEFNEFMKCESFLPMLKSKKLDFKVISIENKL